MNLVSFAVNNYRSITKTSKLPLTDSGTILIGPNNEGKSNLLQALVTAMRIVSRLGLEGVHGRLRILPSHMEAYSWARDFPVSLQEARLDGESLFDLEFRLDDPEISEFRREVGSDLNGTLPIRISIGPGRPKFRVTKKGPGGNVLSKKAEAIAQFIGKRIDFQYIPAIRTASKAEDVVEGLVRRELEVLEKDPFYQAAVKQIADLQAPILKDLASNVRDTLKAFLPTVKSVKISVPKQARFRALTHSPEIVVDDGSPTKLSHKGDGVQSLAALSLMRYASQRSAKGKKLILAIEEPESHLHPNAIHQLRAVLSDIASQHQTIITTHCPLFADRHHPAANILVTGSQARQASGIAEIRDVLGVRTSDNLRHAELLLLVEGETDRTILAALLRTISDKLKDALTGNLLVIEALFGCHKLTYRLSEARNAMCAAYCFLDHDGASREAVKKAKSEGLLTSADVTHATRAGMKESEIEDLLDPSLYAQYLQDTFGVDLSQSSFSKNKGKWSIRMAEAFHSQGKIWDDVTEKQAKVFIAGAVSSAPAAAMPPHCRASVDALAAALEARVSRSKAAQMRMDIAVNVSADG
jgi:putative ATP-dependent endonuclease of the OLD family